ERHQALIQKRICRARRLDRELRVKLYRVLQIAEALLQQRRHLLETSGGSECAFSRGVIFLLQQRKDRVRAVTRVNLRICLLEFQDTIAEIDILQLGAEKD